MKQPALVLALLALGACSTVNPGPDMPKGTALPPPGTTAAPHISLETMKAMVKTLAADEFEGRAPSTTTEPKVLDYIVGEFRAAGLHPGNNGKWLQEVPTVEITASNASRLMVTGKGAPLSYAYGPDYVAASYRVVPKTSVKDSELVFVGYGINAPELGWNDYAGIDMRGKTAVILINDPDYAEETEQGLFKGRRMPGQYGAARTTVRNQQVVRVDGENGLLVIKGGVPGPNGGFVVIRQTNKLG